MDFLFRNLARRQTDGLRPENGIPWLSIVADYGLYRGLMGKQYKNGLEREKKGVEHGFEPGKRRGKNGVEKGEKWGKTSFKQLFKLNLVRWWNLEWWGMAPLPCSRPFKPFRRSDLFFARFKQLWPSTGKRRPFDWTWKERMHSSTVPFPSPFILFQFTAHLYFASDSFRLPCYFCSCALLEKWVQWLRCGAM